MLNSTYQIIYITYQSNKINLKNCFVSYSRQQQVVSALAVEKWPLPLVSNKPSGVWLFRVLNNLADAFCSQNISVANCLNLYTEWNWRLSGHFFFFSKNVFHFLFLFALFLPYCTTHLCSNFVVSNFPICELFSVYSIFMLVFCPEHESKLNIKLNLWIFLNWMSSKLDGRF